MHDLADRLAVALAASDPLPRVTVRQVSLAEVVALAADLPPEPPDATVAPPATPRRLPRPVTGTP